MYFCIFVWEDICICVFFCGKMSQWEICIKKTVLLFVFVYFCIFVWEDICICVFFSVAKCRSEKSVFIRQPKSHRPTSHCRPAGPNYFVFSFHSSFQSHLKNWSIVFVFFFVTLHPFLPVTIPLNVDHTPSKNCIYQKILTSFYNYKLEIICYRTTCHPRRVC